MLPGSWMRRTRTSAAEGGGWAPRAHERRHLVFRDAFWLSTYEGTREASSKAVCIVNNIEHKCNKRVCNMPDMRRAAERQPGDSLAACGCRSHANIQRRRCKAGEGRRKIHPWADRGEMARRAPSRASKKGRAPGYHRSMMLLKLQGRAQGQDRLGRAHRSGAKGK